ncbi:hypothetical protein [Thiomicrorhabdus xiamenensis]|uniref:Uncharacterized protein n=1 Tax=Thiomicrorhabdus xiamenensis TaxID=2739063 RepID=A0A7D4P3R5_9GAMM|nr:hypothetical protein [Thiomicrorhabdus xiamenensis]QKI88776.1 hypothetical protein HQN79_03930 [Thiomicrorhabdus xiamenensis]
MIAILRLWVVVLILTVLTWLLLKYIGKRQSFWLVLLFWVVAVFGSIGLMYGLSVWVAGQ